MQNSAARSSIDVGSVVAGTYTIEALIGRGGMGAVFLASHNRLPGKKVAIKVLHAELDGEEVLARFNREAKIASLLSHPNIVHIEDYNVTADGMPYVVLEYLQGESLAQRLRNGPLSLDQTSSIIRQVASALAAAHGKGIVHRDLKPANIFIVPSEIDGVSREIAKVLDFGISKMRDGSTVKTQDSALLGTPQYMAPEQALGQHDKVDQRTDIFALGAIVYEMLSGQPAFSGQTIPEVVFKVVYEQPVDIGTRVPSLPDTVKLAIQTAMSKSADERYPSVSAFIEALTGAPVSVMRVAKPPAPDVGFAAGSNLKTPASTADAAVAQTMASGNHGTSPLPVVDGTAATIASQQGAASPLSRTVNAADGAAATIAQASPVPARRSRAPLAIVGGILLAAAAAAGVFFVMRSPSKPAEVAQSTKPHDHPAPTTPSAPAATEPAAPEQPEGQDQPAAVATPPTHDPADTNADTTSDSTNSEASAETGSNSEPATGPKADAKTDTKTDSKTPKTDSKTPAKTDSRTPAKTDSKAKPPVETDDDDATDPGADNTAAERLKAAEKAFRNGQWDATIRAANSVFASEDARPKQRSRARVFHGVASCHKNDMEGARIDLRVLARSPALRQQLLAGCRTAGLDLR